MKATLAGNQIAVGPSARTLAKEILYSLPSLLKPGGPLFRLITAGLLPAELRKAYGLGWNRRREKTFKLSTLTIRILLPLVPRPLRIVPQARAAERRAINDGVLE
jgi:uncharacterized protein (DUF2236 family)